MSRSALVITAAFVAALGITETANAQEMESGTERVIKSSAFEIGVRAGGGLGFGSVFERANGDNVRLIDNGNFTVPLWFDVGYRFHPNVYVGAFGTFQWISPKHGVDSFCNDQMDNCSAYNVIGGVMARIYVAPQLKADPWIGFGVAYEYLRNATTQGPVESHQAFHGFQFANVQAGADWDVGAFVLGPYASFALGEYTRYSAEVKNAGPFSVDRSGSVNDLGSMAIHGWASLGIRGAYNL